MKEKIDYDPALDGVLSGRGTTSLQINGRAVTLDARALGVATLLLDNVSHDAAAPFSVRLLPGRHFVYTPYPNDVQHFSVANDGTIDYDSALEGALTGSGTTNLQVNGREVTLNASGLGVATLLLDNVSHDAAAPFSVRLLPGRHFVYTPYANDLQYFTVANDGTIDYDPALDGVFTGRGTTTLQINGRAITIDARALFMPFVVLDNVSYDATAPLYRQLLPGQHFLYVNPNDVWYFTVAQDGTIDYDPALDNILTGRGTSTLVFLPTLG